MIIDCHGHFTTVPRTLHAWREKQLAHVNDPGNAPKTSDLKISDDELLQIEEGSLYPALQRMLREGWLESDAGVSAKGRPTRIYKITEAGLRRLEQEVSSFAKMFAGINRVLAVTEI